MLQAHRPSRTRLLRRVAAFGRAYVGSNAKSIAVAASGKATAYALVIA